MLIEQLTTKQLRAANEFVAKWDYIASNTEQHSDTEIEDAIKSAYSCASYDAPKDIIIVDSPSAVLEYCYMNEYILNQYTPLLTVGNIHHPDSKTTKGIKDPVFNYVSNEIWHRIYGVTTVKLIVKWDIIRHTIMLQLPQYPYQRYVCWNVGQHSCHVFCFFDYCRTVLQIDCSQLNGLFAVSKVANWWISLPEIAIVSRKPTYSDSYTITFNDGVSYDTGNDYTEQGEKKVE